MAFARLLPDVICGRMSAGPRAGPTGPTAPTCDVLAAQRYSTVVSYRSMMFGPNHQWMAQRNTALVGEPCVGRR